ncbi:MAG TPA: hypothetical protein HPP80_03185 [Rhodospirillaceae bacterium]|nr:hypothetical protein [Rhodospirillaceae bacterium]
MFARKNIDIQLGSRFVKADDKSQTVWRVEALWTATDGLPHARLNAGPTRSDLRTVAIAALSDRKAWLPLGTTEQSAQ